jgi:hypothetical protein
VVSATATSAISVDAKITASGAATSSAVTLVAVNAGYVRLASVAVSGVSSVTITAVKKWEPQPITPETWTPISATEENWTVLGFPEYLEAA